MVRREHQQQQYEILKQRQANELKMKQSEVLHCHLTVDGLQEAVKSVTFLCHCHNKNEAIFPPAWNVVSQYC